MKKFLFNGIVMTLTSLLLRWVGVVYNGYISTVLGSEGLGIYSLVETVFGFAITFACSGIGLGATRLVSEALAEKNEKDIKKSVVSCVCYALFFSVSALLVLFFFAEFIGESLLGDRRTVESIKILSFSLPFIALSSVFSGYFSAVKKAYKGATSAILERMVQIGLTVSLITMFFGENIESACISLSLGTLISEAISFVYNLLLYLFDKNPNCINKEGENNHFKKLISISIPLAFSAYARSGLITIEHLLIPRGLIEHGFSYAESMSTYGIIQGMVFPIIMFPSCIIYSFSGLLVPELAGFNKLNNKEKINRTVYAALKYTLLFSIAVAGILTCYSYELSVLIYKTDAPYEYIRIFAPLVVVMYVDAAIDGVLKGLNEQIHSMIINIADAALSVLLVFILVPVYGIKGYVYTIFACEIFNCSMSLVRLIKICFVNLSLNSLLVKPIFAMIAASYTSLFLFEVLSDTVFLSGVNLFFRISVTVFLYLFFINGFSLNKKIGAIQI